MFKYVKADTLTPTSGTVTETVTKAAEQLGYVLAKQHIETTADLTRLTQTLSRLSIDAIEPGSVAKYKEQKSSDLHLLRKIEQRANEQHSEVEHAKKLLGETWSGEFGQDVLFFLATGIGICACISRGVSWSQPNVSFEGTFDLTATIVLVAATVVFMYKVSKNLYTIASNARKERALINEANSFIARDNLYYWIETDLASYQPYSHRGRNSSEVVPADILEKATLLAENLGDLQLKVVSANVQGAEVRLNGERDFPVRTLDPECPNTYRFLEAVLPSARVCIGFWKRTEDFNHCEPGPPETPSDAEVPVG